MGARSGKEKKGKGVFKVIMLGISGSGKSTFVKQMKILYSGGFSDAEIESFKTIVRSNLLIGMKELAKQVAESKNKLSEKNRKKVRFLNERNHFEFETMEWDGSLVKKLLSLWEDQAIQQAWKESHMYQHQIINMDYMLENVDRIASSSFVPNQQDILLARQRTTGFSVTSFMKEKYRWDLIDCGGQIPERSKWNTAIGSDATAVIFFAGLDEFNMTSAEDKTKSKMQISMEVFKEVMRSELLDNSTLILFLNKVDLLEKKLANPDQITQFRSKYPQFNGQVKVGDVCNFIEGQFTSLAPNRQIRTHFTCVINTNMMETVFQAVKEDIFMRRLGLSVSAFDQIV